MTAWVLITQQANTHGDALEIARSIFPSLIQDGDTVEAAHNAIVAGGTVYLQSKADYEAGLKVLQGGMKQSGDA